MDTEKMLYDIIDRIGKTQDDTVKILAEIRVDLRYHIRRTDLLEEEVRLLREEIRKPLPWKSILAGITGVAAAIGAVLQWFSK